MRMSIILCAATDSSVGHSRITSKNDIRGKHATRRHGTLHRHIFGRMNEGGGMGRERKEILEIQNQKGTEGWEAKATREVRSARWWTSAAAVKHLELLHGDNIGRLNVVLKILCNLFLKLVQGDLLVLLVRQKRREKWERQGTRSACGFLRSHARCPQMEHLKMLTSTTRVTWSLETP